MAASKCWVAHCNPAGNGQPYNMYFCAASVTVKSVYQGVAPFNENNVNMFDVVFGFSSSNWVRSCVVEQANPNQIVTSAAYPEGPYGNCSSCSASSFTYDCLNGNCVENANNQGYFETIEDCQKVCAFSCGEGKQCVDPNVFCPPGKVCLDSLEFSQIQALISRISQEICG